MNQQRALDKREIVLRVFFKNDPDQDAVKPIVHVFRIGLATGTAVAACKDGDHYLTHGYGYWQYMPFDWIVKNAPICNRCKQRLIAEGLLQSQDLTV
jgi:hypothetical protein